MRKAKLQLVECSRELDGRFRFEAAGQVLAVFVGFPEEGSLPGAGMQQLQVRRNPDALGDGEVLVDGEHVRLYREPNFPVCVLVYPYGPQESEITYG